MSANELRRRMHDDIGAMLDRTEQERARERIVHDKRQAMLMGNGRDRLNIEQVALRIADALGEQRLRLVGNRLAEIIRIARIDEPDGDAELLQRRREQIVRSAIQAGGRYDLIPGTGNIKNRVGDRRLPGSGS